MKMIFDKTNFVSIASAATVIIGASFVYAQSPSPEAKDAEERSSRPSKAGFCTMLERHTQTIDRHLADRMEKLEARRADRHNMMEERRESRQDRREEHRRRWDENRSEHFTMLKDRAQTNEQRLAAIAFKEAAAAAVVERRFAMDKAILAFRLGMDKIIADRKETADEATGAFKQALADALAATQKSCDTENIRADVRKEFQERMTAARTQFAKDRQQIEKAAEAVKPLVEARNKEVKNIQEGFRTAVKKAHDAFVSAWEAGNPEVMEESPSPESKEKERGE